MKSIFLGFVLLGANSVFGTTVYQNTTTDTFSALQYAANGYAEIGDRITLAGTDRLATQATAQFFNNGIATTFSATLSFFNVGAGMNPVGSLLNTYTVNNITISGYDPEVAGSGLVTVTFGNLNLLAPTNLIFTLSVSNLSNRGADLGVELFSPKTVGTSNDATFISRSGGVYSTSTTDPGFGDAFFSLDAVATSGVPEPSTLALLGMGLVVIDLARRRK